MSLRLAIAIAIAILLGGSSAPQAEPAPRPEFGALWVERARGATQPRCLTAAIERVLGRPAEAPRSRVNAWIKLATGCNLGWRDHGLVDETALRGHYDLAVALLGAGFPRDCIQIATSVVSPGFGEARRLSSDPAIEKLATDFEALDKRCRDANEAQLAGFTTRGIALVRGAATSTYASDRRCPGIRTDGRTYIAHEGALVDAFCCGIDRAGILEHAGTRYVRVSGPPSRVCDGGTAHLEPAAIYKIAGDKLELVADHSIGWN